MFIFGYFIEALAKIIHYGLNFYMMIVFVSALLSWVRPDPYNPIVRFVNQVTEPVLFQLRRRLPLVYGGIDFSAIVLIFAIVFLDTFLVQSLMRLSVILK
jgi:YggT family protein